MSKPKIGRSVLNATCPFQLGFRLSLVRFWVESYRGEFRCLRGLVSKQIEICEEMAYAANVNWDVDVLLVVTVF